MAFPKGKALVQHMEKDHNYVVWNPPAPNTSRYREWKRAHEEDHHGRWSDQQDHDHGVTPGPQPGDMVRVDDPRHTQHGAEGRLRSVRGSKATMFSWGSGAEIDVPYSSLKKHGNVQPAHLNPGQFR